MCNYIVILLILILSVVLSSCTKKNNENILSDVSEQPIVSTDTSSVSSYDMASDETQTNTVTSENLGSAELTSSEEPVTSRPPITENTKAENATVTENPADESPTQTTSSSSTTAPTIEPPQPSVPTYTKPTSAEVSESVVNYINKLREEEGHKTLTPLSGLKKVADYRSRQIINNFAHDTHDIREATAYYKYGRFVDMTIVGYDPSYSYYEYVGGEAITKGSWSGTAEQIGKEIAELVRSSPSHWSYIGSDDYGFTAVGVTHSDTAEYEWYVCIIVCETNDYE